MTYARFLQALTMLAESYRATMSDAAMEGYWMALQDVPDAEMGIASKRALMECKFMPTPAELRVLALGKDWKARLEARRAQDATTAQLKRLEATPATPEEIAQSRREWEESVRRLAEGKTA